MELIAQEGVTDAFHVQSQLVGPARHGQQREARVLDAIVPLSPLQHAPSSEAAAHLLGSSRALKERV